MFLPIHRVPRSILHWFRKRNVRPIVFPHTDTYCRERPPSDIIKHHSWTFKSTKSNKRYIVEIEYFSNHFLGLKFYWKGVASSKDRYSLMTNDYEPRIIVMSCVYIMLEYFKRDKCASFGFVAADDLNSADNPNQPNKRFRFYRRMMLSIFRFRDIRARLRHDEFDLSTDQQ